MATSHPIGFHPGVMDSLTWFPTSPQSDDPDCLCSFCGKPFMERDFPLRFWPGDGAWEIRLHVRCWNQVSPNTIWPEDPDD